MGAVLARYLSRHARWALPVALVLMLLILPSSSSTIYNITHTPKEHPFTIRAIDTMKFSRDISGQVLDHPQAFTKLIDTQVRLVAEAGATHVAIATPYDAKFLPVLRLWVASARAHGLNVWFRGNFSGWEGWFGFAKIDRTEHKKLLQSFLRTNPDLFVDGDLFTPCPECENGGPGDPRLTGDRSGYNSFLRDELALAENEFARQGKTIAIYPSMNGDIANEIITPATVRAFDGTILIDHYVRSTNQFKTDLSAISRKLDATIGLGEFGAPIPDLNGYMTERQQAEYVDGLFRAMMETGTPIANYWTLAGGSTALLNDNGTVRLAYTTVQNYFKAYNVYGAVYNSLGEPIAKASVHVPGSPYHASTTYASYQIFVPRQYQEIRIEAEGYEPITVSLPTNSTTTVVKHDVFLTPTNPSWQYRARIYLYDLLSRID